MLSGRVQKSKFKPRELGSRWLFIAKHKRRGYLSFVQRNATSHPRAAAVLGVTSLAIFAVGLDTTMLFVAFPAILQSFPDATTAELSWVLNAYTVVFGAAVVPAGRLADKLGRRATFVAGVAIFTLASVVCGLAPSAPV